MGIAGGTPDWGRLYNAGRCKYFGVAWTAEEHKLIQASKTPQEVINQLREGYIDEHKKEIIDPNAKVRQNNVEWNAAAEEYELLYGKKPHHFATLSTIRKKISEKAILPMEEVIVAPKVKAKKG